MKKTIYIFSVLFLLCAGALKGQAENTLTAVVTPTDGQHFTVDLELSNTDAFISFQADLVLPEGVTLQENSLQTTARLSGLTVEASMVSSNRVRVVGYSNTNTKITAGSGKMLSLVLVTREDVELNSAALTLRNLLFTKANYEEVTLMGSTVDLVAGETVEGDLNGDGILTTADVSLLVEKVMAGATGTKYDINKDGRVSVSDVTALVNILLKQ